MESTLKQDVGHDTKDIKAERGNIDEILCRRPCDPNSKNFKKELKQDLENLVPIVQTHKHTNSCYKNESDVCRYGFFRPIVEESYVSENQEIHLRRLDSRINNYQEEITTSVRCNNDIKFLPSGKDCRALAFYVTEYQTKNELSTYNTLEILESLLSSIEKSGQNVIADRKILKMLNRVLTEKEVSAPHVIHLSLGHSDKYSSHQFRTANVHLMLSWVIENEQDESSIALNEVTKEVWMNLEHTENEDYILVNQEIDYHRRGESLKDICFYDYVQRIEKEKIDQNESEYAVKKGSGRPKMERYKFDSSHPQSKTHIQRERNVKLLPKLSYFPPSEIRNCELFSKIMLLLFKPHSNYSDLKAENVTWFEEFSNYEFDHTHQQMIENLREMHVGMKEREDLRQERLYPDKKDKTSDNLEVSEYAAVFDIDNTEMFECDIDIESMGFLDTIERRSHCVDGLRHFQESDIKIKIDDDAETDCHVENVDSQSLIKWKKEIQQKKDDIILQRNEAKQEYASECMAVNSNEIPDDVEVMQISTSSTYPYHDVANEICGQFELNGKQKEVYWLFIDNVLKRLCGEETKQIISHMGGMAGCGKSRVIKAIKAFHDRIGINNCLKIASPTGTSAALISGSTIHSIAHILPSKSKNRKNTSSSKYEETWQDVKLLICDECSMIGTNLLALLSQAITKGKHSDTAIPFGGIDVLLAGKPLNYCIIWIVSQGPYFQEGGLHDKLAH